MISIFDSEYFNFDIVLYNESDSCQQIFDINLTKPNKPAMRFNWIETLNEIADGN